MASRGAPDSRAFGRLAFGGLALGIGLVAGFGACLFKWLIALMHNLFFLGKFSFTYAISAHTPPPPWGAFIILVPPIGAVAVVFLVKNFAPEAKGHGVPEVLDAIFYARGVIRPIVGVIKSVASAISIGAGGSVGREGPMIQIGASFGSTVGARLKMPEWQRFALIAAGGGGGIAAAFNTPVGGILFAIEIMMVELRARTLVPVAIATVTSTYIERLVFGTKQTFFVATLPHVSTRLGHPWELLVFAVLGCITGVVSLAFIRSIYVIEDFFNAHIPGGYYGRHITGMFLVGLLLYAMMWGYGRYYIEGVGYATIQDVLSGDLTVIGFLLLLALLKLAVTALTLGSGASGGVFSPCLFLGATVGAAFGWMLRAMFPGIGVNPAELAIAGMAGVVGGATGAAMAAIVMTFEMTLDYAVIIPLTLTVAVSYGLRKYLLRDSVYTYKETKRDHPVPDALEADVIHRRRAADVVDREILVVPATTAVSDLAKVLRDRVPKPLVVLTAGAAAAGVIAGSAVVAASAENGRELEPVSNVPGISFTVAEAATPLIDVLSKMREEHAAVALVLPRAESPIGELSGIITRQTLGDALIGSTEFFSR